MSEREFWRCTIPAFFRMLERHQEAERREDWRAYFAGIASVLEKPPKPSEAFPSLAGLGGSGGFRREDLPAHWTVYTGKDVAVVQQLQVLVAAGGFERMGARQMVQ